MFLVTKRSISLAGIFSIATFAMLLWLIEGTSAQAAATVSPAQAQMPGRLSWDIQDAGLRSSSPSANGHP